MRKGLENLGSEPDDISQIIGSLLLRGHVIVGSATSLYARVVSVHRSLSEINHPPVLGIGVDGTAERALARALITYGLREQAEMDSITSQDFPESTIDQIPPTTVVSQFDCILWNGELRLYRDEEDYVAVSSNGGTHLHESVEGRAFSPLGALDSLASRYDFWGSERETLPLIAR